MSLKKRTFFMLLSSVASFSLWLAAAEACMIHDHGCRFHGAGLQVLPGGIDPAVTSSNGLVAVLGWNNTNDLDIHGLVPDGYGPYITTGSGLTGSDVGIGGGDSYGHLRANEPFIGAGEHNRHIYYSQYDMTFQSGNAAGYISGDVSGGSANPHPPCNVQGAVSCEAIAIVGNDLPQGVPFTFQAYNFNDKNQAPDPSPTNYSLRAYATGRYVVVNQSQVDAGVHGTLSNTGDLSPRLPVILGRLKNDPHAIGVRLARTGNAFDNNTVNALKHFKEIDVNNQAHSWELLHRQKQREARSLPPHHDVNKADLQMQYDLARIKAEMTPRELMAYEAYNGSYWDKAKYGIFTISDVSIHFSIGAITGIPKGVGGLAGGVGSAVYYARYNNKYYWGSRLLFGEEYTERAFLGAKKATDKLENIMGKITDSMQNVIVDHSGGFYKPSAYNDLGWMNPSDLGEYFSPSPISVFGKITKVTKIKIPKDNLYKTSGDIIETVGLIGNIKAPINASNIINDFASFSGSPIAKMVDKPLTKWIRTKSPIANKVLDIDIAVNKKSSELEGNIIKLYGKTKDKTVELVEKAKGNIVRWGEKKKNAIKGSYNNAMEFFSDATTKAKSWWSPQ